MAKKIQTGKATKTVTASRQTSNNVSSQTQTVMPTQHTFVVKQSTNVSVPPRFIPPIFNIPPPPPDASSAPVLLYSGDDIFVSNVIKTIEAKDVTNLTAEFVYNFFDKDENIAEKNIDQSYLYTQMSTSEYISAPKFIALNWAKPVIESTDDVKEPDSDYDIRRIIDDGLLNYENDEKSSRFTSIKLKDKSPSSRFFESIDTYQSGMSEENQSDFEKLKNTQSIDEYISGKYNSKIANNKLNKINGVTLSAIISNNILSEITSQIISDPISPFSDELSSTTISSNSTSSEDFEDLSPDDRFLNIRELTDPVTSVWTGPAQLQQIEVAIIGYIIEKRESTHEGIIVQHDDIIIRNDDLTSCIDYNITYGSSYEYFVRTIYLSRHKVYNEDVPEYALDTYAIASAGSNRENVIAKEFIAPVPPTNIQFRFYSNFDSLRIGWDYPINKQRDIKIVQVFRRKSVEEAFTLIREINFDDSTKQDTSSNSGSASSIKYIDYTRVEDSNLSDGFIDVKIAPGFYYDIEFNDSSNYIYALATIDAHGYASQYSDQFEVSYNNIKNKVKTKYISKQGAPRAHPNLYLEVDALPDVITDINYSNLSIGLFEQKLQTIDGEAVSVSSQSNDDKGIISGEYKIQFISREQQQSALFGFEISTDDL